MERGRESVKDSTFLLASVVEEREGGGEMSRRRRSYPVQLGKEEKKRESFDILVACIVENSYNSRYKW